MRYFSRDTHPSWPCWGWHRFASTTAWPLYNGVGNIVFLGSEYPIRLFSSPTLAASAAIYAVILLRRRPSPKPPQHRWVAALVGAAVLVLMPSAVIIRSTASLFEPRKVITLPMSWKRGDLYYGANFITLEASCLSNTDPHCYCRTDFPFINSPAFADYIRSFGNQSVPVQYEVFYGRNGEAISANLVSVGTWAADSFREREGEGVLGSGLGNIRRGESVTFSRRTPGDCFARLQHK